MKLNQEHASHICAIAAAEACVMQKNLVVYFYFRPNSLGSRVARVCHQNSLELESLVLCVDKKLPRTLNVSRSESLR